MKLRKLRADDAQGMLEWMHDPEIQKCFRRNMMSATKETVMEFISAASVDYPQSKDMHWAIADGGDEYMGTVSLKNIEPLNSNAEYAIVLRKKAQGRGLGSWATQNVLEYAFLKLKLERVYLNVLEENTTAIQMYEKNGFVYEGTFRNAILHDGKYKNLRWYSILKNELAELENGK